MDWKKWLRWMGFFGFAACVQLAVNPKAQWWFVPAALLIAALPIAGLVWLDGVLTRRKGRQISEQ
jgi:hypothetical protein